MSALSVHSFVHPRATSLSLPPSRQQSPSILSMSASLPDDKFNQKNSQSSSSRDAGDALPHHPANDEFGALGSDFNYAAHRQHGGADGAPPPPHDAAVPAARRVRWEREALVRSKFASGDQVFELRATAARLRRELVAARSEAGANPRRVGQLEDELLTLNGRDAEFMHAVSLELMDKAQAAGNEEMVEKYRTQVEDAQSCIPQLNMHGLWVGKYESGYELINVTYSGDTLIATKVTGDQNVPKGEASFTVDLAPPFSAQTDGAFAPALEPIELQDAASRQWGQRYLPRQAGRGQVASRGFANAQWMEGQMILVGKFFSFAWVPLGHQVFFGRPSAELVVKMLKEAQAEDLRRDHVAVMRDVAEGMWDETYWDETERSSESYDLDEGQGCFE